jgi:heat shock protein HslJ
VRRTSYAAVLVLILAPACSATKPAATTPAPAASSAPAAASASPLANSSWLLEQLGGKDVIDRVEVTLAFDGANGVSGSATCNTFHGKATISGDTIAFQDLVTTRMACQPAYNEQETAFLTALGGAERFSIEEPFLTIHVKGSSQPMHFIRSSGH